MSLNTKGMPFLCSEIRSATFQWCHKSLVTRCHWGKWLSVCVCVFKFRGRVESPGKVLTVSIYAIVYSAFSFNSFKFHFFVHTVSGLMQHNLLRTTL